MTDTLAIYLDDGVTAATSVTFGPVEAGDETAEQIFRCYLNKGTPGGSLDQVALRIWMVDGSGHEVTSGIEALDGRYVKGRVVGAVTDADPTMPVFSETTAYGLGAGIDLRFPYPISGGCAVRFALKLAPKMGFGAAAVSASFGMTAVVNEPGQPIEALLADQGSGILTGLGEAGCTEWVVPPFITASGSPDDQVHLSRWHLMDGGMPRRYALTQDVTLNQNDGAAAALSATEGYWALFTQDTSSSTTATLTKGAKAVEADAVLPAIPADEELIGWVMVRYGGGGSVINTADITQRALRGRFFLESDGALNAVINPGRAKLGGARYVDSRQQLLVPVPDSATRWIWLMGAGGSLNVGLTSTDRRPFPGAIKIGKSVAAGGVATVTDERCGFWEPNAIRLRLKFFDEETAPQDNIDMVTIDQPIGIDRMTVAAFVPSAGASGQTIFDVLRNREGTAVTLFTNGGGSPESRPSIAADTYSDATAWPEVTDGLAGDVLTMSCVEITTGGTQRAAKFEMVITGAPCR